MESHIGYIMTVSNSIIGVSILAMPFCFKQCGIILAILMLLASSCISRLTCHYLLKSANMARRRTFELLAFHTFGSMGKLIVELGIIGFLMGTCIAFFVIIGDLGPTIIAKVLELNNTDMLRTTLLVCMAAFCVLPLGLLKNVESLSSVSTATIGFYFCLVLKTVAESANHITKGDWVMKVELWRPAGILQCFPIFAMALSCQTQLFEIYETLPNASLEKMNYVVRMAVNICVCVYICVGVFGYIAFASGPFTGNILMSFSPSMMTDAMKIGFVLSVACSFPLVIFPCRASLYSLLFRKYLPPKFIYACQLFTQNELDDKNEQDNEGYNPYEGINNFIPETRFKLLTFFIVIVSLIIGIMIPNIEVVLGLVGSTIGTLICVIFPVTCFICISTKNTNERFLAQIMLFIGVIMMVMGTYANLYAMEESHSEIVIPKDVVKVNQDNFIKNIKYNAVENINKPLETKKVAAIFPPDIKIEPVEKIEVRQEPPQPEEPMDNVLPKMELEARKTEVKNIELEKMNPQKNDPLKIQLTDLQLQKNKLPDNKQESKKNNILKIESQKLESEKMDSQNDKRSKLEESAIKADIPPTNTPSKIDEKSETIKPVEVDKAAIEKDEKEFLEEIEDKNQNEELLETLKKTKEEQQQIILNQKKLLKEFEKQQQERKDKELEGIKKENEIKIKVVSQLVEIAKKTLESLGNDPNGINKETENQKVNKEDLITQERNKDNVVEKERIEINVGDDNKKNKIDGSNKEDKINIGDEKNKESIGNDVNIGDGSNKINDISVGNEKNKENVVNIGNEMNAVNKISNGNEINKVNEMNSEKLVNNNELNKKNDENDVNKETIRKESNLEILEEKLKKLNSTIENMLPFPLKILNDKKNLMVSKENQVLENEKLEIKSGILNNDQLKKEIKQELKNDVMKKELETKIDEPVVEKKEIKQVEEKNDNVKKENDNKIGRDLLAEVNSKESMLRRKRETLSNDENCKTVDKVAKLMELDENILSKNIQNVLTQKLENDLPQKIQNILPKKSENDLPKISENIPPKKSDYVPQSKNILNSVNSVKENILPQQIDVLNSLKENIVNNLKFSQDILKTNFINLHKRKK